MDWTLKSHNRFTPRPAPLLIVVMDGIGLGPGDEGDAVALARTPVLDWLRANCPWIRLKAHGTAVGLPSDKDMGNSEVGHNALGAGRVFDQGAKLVNAAIESGSLFEGETWKNLIARCRDGQSALHLIGLLSDGNVHSHQDHLHALITRAAEERIEKLFVHILLDGRDVPATSALTYVDRLEEHLAQYDGQDGRTYRIASGGGRMVTTMDRYEADWSIVERGWRAHVQGKGRPFASAREAIETFRREERDIGDQFLPDFTIVENDTPVGPIQDGDSVISFNFRGDRAIEFSKAMEQEEFTHFDRGQRPDVAYAGMMLYDGDQGIPKAFLVSPPKLDRTLGEYLARNRIPQFACSETQKFGHVTYFWNGNRTGAFDPDLETYVEIPSDRVLFEQRPWMKAAEITDATSERLLAGDFRCGRINYANGDMVGHTGDRQAAILAVETVDGSLGRLLQVVREVGGIALVTADHGNSDEMYLREKSGAIAIDKATGRPKARTSHSLNAVPLILYDPQDLEARAAQITPTPDGIGRYLAPEVAGGAGGSGTAPATGGKPAESPAGADSPPSLTLALPPEGGGLANVAATCLELLGYEPPSDYAPSLLRVTGPGA
ncbi:MAG: 2,3-bisphosphoglycerate-independent phosphoglycerate mutase [Candidatus Eisenbacteria sp.]|nr:2,3-bisphosphoglycerate-independent phosphoglycerate mutase [Candidatus Eisenbacteria bacterium]